MEKQDENKGKGNSGRCTKQRSKKRYNRKRRNPNKGRVDYQKLCTSVTTQVVENESVAGLSTASAAKVIEIDPIKEDLPVSGFRLIDMSIFSSFLFVS